jgi:hypothetical protein
MYESSQSTEGALPKQVVDSATRKARAQLGDVRREHDQGLERSAPDSYVDQRHSCAGVAQRQSRRREISRVTHQLLLAEFEAHGMTNVGAEQPHDHVTRSAL